MQFTIISQISNTVKGFYKKYQNINNNFLKTNCYFFDNFCKNIKKSPFSGQKRCKNSKVYKKFKIKSSKICPRRFFRGGGG